MYGPELLDSLEIPQPDTLDPTHILKLSLRTKDLKWLEMEQRRQKRKELAKKKALQEGLGGFGV